MRDRLTIGQGLPVTSIAGWSLLALLTMAVGWKAITESVDLPIYHEVGRQVLAGNYELYPPEVYEPEPSVGGHGFRYLPAVAFAFAVLAYLPYHAAAALLFVLKVLTFAHAISILGRRLRLSSSKLTLIWVVLLAVGGFLVEEFRGGNVQFVIIYLLLLSFDQSERLRTVLPAVAVAVAAAVKITPVVLVAYFGLRKRFAIVASAVALLAAFVVAPGLLWGREHNARLLTGYRNYSATSLAAAENDRNYSIRRVLVSTQPLGISANTANRIWLVLSGLLAIALALIVARPSAHWMTRDVEFALIMACLPLLSPHSQRIYFSYLFVPAAVLFALLKHGAFTARLRAMAGCALALVVASGTVLPLILGGKELSRAYLDYFPYTWGCLAVVVTLFAVAIADRRSRRISGAISRNGSSRPAP